MDRSDRLMEKRRWTACQFVWPEVVGVPHIASTQKITTVYGVFYHDCNLLSLHSSLIVWQLLQRCTQGILEC